MPLVRYLPVIIAVLVLGACAELGRTSDEAARKIVADAEDTFVRIRNHPDLARLELPGVLAGAKGVVILPSVVKAGFLGAGEAGNGVLLTRGSDGTWSDPAFYTLGAASFGPQAGIQGAEMVMVLRSEGAIDAVIKHQGKLGADAGVTVGVIGVGVEGSTTTNVGADIVVYANSIIGLFGGISVEGSVLARRNDLNAAYYGEGATPEAIVLERSYHNAHADSLKAALAAR